MYDTLGATPPPGVAHTQHTHPLSHTHTHTQKACARTHIVSLCSQPRHSAGCPHTHTHTHTHTHIKAHSHVQMLMFSLILCNVVLGCRCSGQQNVHTHTH